MRNTDNMTKYETLQLAYYRTDFGQRLLSTSEQAKLEYERLVRKEMENINKRTDFTSEDWT